MATFPSPPSIWSADDYGLVYYLNGTTVACYCTVTVAKEKPAEKPKRRNRFEQLYNGGRSMRASKIIDKKLDLLSHERGSKISSKQLIAAAVAPMIAPLVNRVCNE